MLVENSFAEYSIPSRYFNCEPIIISDVADVNALVTGTEMKSTIKPRNNGIKLIQTKYKSRGERQVAIENGIVTM